MPANPDPDDPTPGTMWTHADLKAYLKGELQPLAEQVAGIAAALAEFERTAGVSGEAWTKMLADAAIETAKIGTALTAHDEASEARTQSVLAAISEHDYDSEDRHVEVMDALADLAEQCGDGGGGQQTGIRFGAIDVTRGYFQLEMEMAAAVGQPRPIGSFVRGFSGPSHPATFADSSVASAAGLGLGAVLNTKLTDWAALAAGAYDDEIRGFYESWPASVWGDVTVNHEPENDRRDGESDIWCAGIARYVHVAAEVIRRRGLDVKVGGCLMGVMERWPKWAWWTYLDPADRDVATLGVDPYWKHHADPTRGADPAKIVGQIVTVARTAGIGSITIFETAIDRRRYDSEGGGVIGTDETCADWLTGYAQLLRSIPEVRTVCHFHDPIGPASGQARLSGPALTAWAVACLSGWRPVG